MKSYSLTYRPRFTLLDFIPFDFQVDWYKPDGFDDLDGMDLEFYARTNAQFLYFDTLVTENALTTEESFYEFIENDADLFPSSWNDWEFNEDEESVYYDQYWYYDIVEKHLPDIYNSEWYGFHPWLDYWVLDKYNSEV